MSSWFHANDNIFFTRHDRGEVEIMTKEIDGRTNHWTIEADTWASVVASVSVSGETKQTWDEARALHNIPVEERDPWNVK